MYEKYIVLLVFNNSRKTVNVKSILFYSSFSCPSNLMMKKEVVGETTVYRKSPINIEVTYMHTHIYIHTFAVARQIHHILALGTVENLKDLLTRIHNHFFWVTKIQVIQQGSHGI